MSILLQLEKRQFIRAIWEYAGYLTSVSMSFLQRSGLWSLTSARYHVTVPVSHSIYNSKFT